MCYLNPFRHWVPTRKYVISCDTMQRVKGVDPATPKATPRGDKQPALATPKGGKQKGIPKDDRPQVMATPRVVKESAMATPKGAQQRALFVPQGVPRLHDLSPVATPAPTSMQTPMPATTR